MNIVNRANIMMFIYDIEKNTEWWNNMGLIIQYDFLDGTIRYTLSEIEI